jgi:hypothetical protein
MGGVELISLVDADPDLAEDMEDAEIERARRIALAKVRRISKGYWDALEGNDPDECHRGFFVVEGLLSRHVEVMGRRCVELIGHGDVIRPWQWDAYGAHVHAEIGWHVLEPGRLALLDHGLLHRIDPFPQLGVELFSRGIRRAHALAIVVAIGHHQRVDDRLILTLWHLAERWGRVTKEGVVLPLPLGHQRLADLVGAHRPSVTTAMGDLARRGLLSRRPDGNWVLHGGPPDKLRHHPLAATLT